MSSNPAHGVRKTSLVRKATGNHLIITTTLSEAQSPFSGFCYARNRVCDAVFLLHGGSDAYDIVWTFITLAELGATSCRERIANWRFGAPLTLPELSLIETG